MYNNQDLSGINGRVDPKILGIEIEIEIDPYKCTQFLTKAQKQIRAGENTFSTVVLGQLFMEAEKMNLGPNLYLTEKLAQNRSWTYM